jgi:Ca2+-binding RTX toxin-like protein
MESSSGSSVERLESRVLMAVDVKLNDKDQLKITAPAGDLAGDLVELTMVSGKESVQVWVNGAIVDPTPKNSSTTVKRNNINKIIADLGGGDDKIFIGRRETDPREFQNKLKVRCTLVGGDGNDYLESGPQNDLVIGGAGNDTLVGGRGDDVIFASSGNDVVFGENGRDNIYGQDGDDILNGNGNEDALYGVAGADTLTGGEDDDFVNPGNDPGDSADHNDKPHNGLTDDVPAYVDKLIRLGVPEKFRATARS